MTTKTILTVAALGIAGASATMAQVYSVNAVGYVNTTIPANNYALISNPLTGATNTLAALLPSVPENSVLYRFVRPPAIGAFRIATFTKDDNENLNWGDNASDVILPGEGFFLYNPSASSYTVTFVGEVPQGNLTNQVPVDFSLQASKVPQAGLLQTTLGYTPSEGDVVYRYRGTFTGNIFAYVKDDNEVLNWDPAQPDLNVGEGVWIDSAIAKEWRRSFSVN